ncbi:uncharacterized protein LOC143273791 [Peromyscus maniculatus bairdii]|uniref:uncharacterized protein LOC143273791 n=1 Tax=Peromyscus maniculatus bairdii TaxID=230844 RepID=UPI003FCF75C8
MQHLKSWHAPHPRSCVFCGGHHSLDPGRRPPAHLEESWVREAPPPVEAAVFPGGRREHQLRRARATHEHLPRTRPVGDGRVPVAAFINATQMPPCHQHEEEKFFLKAKGQMETQHLGLTHQTTVFCPALKPCNFCLSSFPSCPELPRKETVFQRPAPVVDRFLKGERQTLYKEENGLSHKNCPP